MGEARCTRAQTEERQGGTQQPEQLALKTKQGAMLKHYPTLPSWSLPLLKGIFSHPQRHLHIKLHSPVNQDQHTFLSLSL